MQERFKSAIDDDLEGPFRIIRNVIVEARWHFPTEAEGLALCAVVLGSRVPGKVDLITSVAAIKP
jgi:hypothetical protein